MTVTIHGIQAAQLDEAWPLVWPWIVSACDEIEWDSTHILTDLRARQQQLWVVCDAGQPVACVTSRIDVNRNGKRVLFIPILAGNGMEQWLGKVVEEMADFARTNECTELQAASRRGWVRALKQYGARETSVIVSLEV